MKTFLLILALSVSAFSQVPKFSDYPAKEIYKGKNAKVVITKSDRLFRTRLREGATGDVNFAGHYIVTFWGCGTECLSGAIIDAKTGTVTDIPFTICCWEHYGEDDFKPIGFKPKSDLIVFSGMRNEKEGDKKTHYYKFERGKLTFIKSI